MIIFLVRANSVTGLAGVYLCNCILSSRLRTSHLLGGCGNARGFYLAKGQKASADCEVSELIFEMSVSRGRPADKRNVLEWWRRFITPIRMICRRDVTIR